MAVVTLHPQQISMPRAIAARSQKPNIVIINPKFEASYWGMEFAMPLLGKKANLPTACLPLLAALTPDSFNVRLIDENVEPIDWKQIERADIVALTGMSVQQYRMKEILQELKQRNCFTVVGGPWVTVQENYFGDLADVIFIGEAEETWPQFLNQWLRGSFSRRYEQAEKTDMTRVPTPRYELLDTSKYVFGSLQISRGCPFQCEFCDIIVTFGRRPRLKASQQVILELEAMRRARLNIAFIVDDNLIGNKKAIKPILQDISDWQKQRGYPFTFFAEASIDLADDAELMQLMVEANVQAVFVGVETTNLESLKETKKFQNLREGGSITEKIRRIQDNGMEVWTGMILGFDNDTTAIFDSQVEFVQSARIVHAMCGMLSAIPKTPLYARLESAQRLDNASATQYGTNIIPLQMTRDQLRDGYKVVMSQLNDLESFFDRVDSLFLDPSFEFGAAQKRYLSARPIRRTLHKARLRIACAYIQRRLLSRVEDEALRRAYSQRLRAAWQRRPDLNVYFVYLLKCAIHYHYSQINRMLLNDRIVNTF